jgi:hypothetical protein
MISPSRHRRTLAAVLGLTGLLAAGACQNHLTDTLLEATDPDLIIPGNLDTPEGADAIRTGALYRFSGITGQQESTWLFGGQLADEWTATTTFVQNTEADSRSIKDDNSVMLPMFRNLNRTRTASNQGIAALKKWRPTQTANIAELYFARGYAELQLALDFCNGIPLSDAATALVAGTPLTGKEVTERALASFDSALTINTGTDAASIAITNAVKVARGRALVNLNRIPEAVAAVAGVPTNYIYTHTYLQVSGDNQNWSFTNGNFRYSLGDSAEGNARNFLVANALPFYSAGDPRIKGALNITIRSGKPDTLKAQDGQTYYRSNTIYPGRESPTVVASGVDARLIEAEGFLRANDIPNMMAILNALRAAPQNLGAFNSPVMTPLVAPATPADARALYFREKAFWTFGRGQRLGDLRRLVRQYQLPVNQVYPVGKYFKGGDYGNDVNLPVPQAEFNNPNFTGCIDRLP